MNKRLSKQVVKHLMQDRYIWFKVSDEANKRAGDDLYLAIKVNNELGKDRVKKVIP
jgi:hypothetical protein